MVHKTNVLTFAGDLWQRTFDKVAKEYPGVQTDYCHVDAASMFFLTNPERFDVIVLDPPAFITRRKDHKAGLQAYRRANELAMRLLSRDGLLVSGSCSMHLAREELVDVLRASARHIDRTAQIVHHGHQGADHPIHPAIPETEYLKSVFARVLPV